MRRAISLFVVVVLLGVVMSTLVYRHFQSAVEQRLALENVAKIELKDADKKLIETRESMSKWLLGLAFALLPGLIVRRTKDKVDEGETRFLPMLAAALLVISIYGAFLVQDSIIFVLSRGPLHHLYGPVSDLPLLIQFWSFFFALIVLLIFWFRPKDEVKWPALLSVVILMLPTFDAVAVPTTDNALVTCVCGWSVSRKIDLSDINRMKAARLIQGIAARSQVKIPVGCSYANAMLDQLRLGGFLVGLSDTSASLTTMLLTTEIDLAKPAVSISEALKTMLEASMLWRSPSGLIRIESKVQGTAIMIDAKRVGFATLELRISPGEYTIEGVRDGKVVAKHRVFVKDGEPWTKSFD